MGRGVEPIDEPVCERPIVGGQHNAEHRCQLSRVIGSPARARQALELGDHASGSAPAQLRGGGGEPFGVELLCERVESVFAVLF